MIHLVRYIWDDSDPKHPHWRIENGSGIDVRPVLAQGQRGGESGFALSASAPTGLIWEQLTSKADPSGEAGPRPLMPGTDGMLRLHLQGERRRERFRWGHPHTNQVQAVLQRGFERMWEETGGHEICRKALGFLCRKHGLKGDDWRLIVPRRLHAHVPGPKDPETTITESFNTADSTTLGPDLSWTEMAANILPYNCMQVVGNQFCAFAGDVANQMARANTSLSGADHYSQISVTALGSGTNNVWMGACVRMSAAAEQTAYWATAKQNTDTITLYKTVTGADTALGTPVSITISGLPKLIKCEVNGTTLKSFWDGVETESITDTSLDGSTVGGLRCGIQGFGVFDTTSVLGDSFEAADLGSPPADTSLPIIHRPTRFFKGR